MTLAGAVGLTTPVAQAAGWEHPGVGGAAGRIVGLTLYGATVLLVLNTSVLLLIERATRGWVTVPRWAWAGIGAGLTVIPVIAFSLPESANLWERVTEAVKAQLSAPALLVSESLPMMLAGGVFAALLFDKARTDESRVNTAAAASDASSHPGKGRSADAD